MRKFSSEEPRLPEVEALGEGLGRLDRPAINHANELKPIGREILKLLSKIRS